MYKVRASIFALSFVLLSACGASSDQTQSVATDVIADGRYELDIYQSSIYWESYEAIGRKTGSIELSRGELIVRNGVPDKGSFSINMKSIRVSDQKAADSVRIINQLKSDAFFASADYPEARFDITRISPYIGFDDFDYEIEGDLDVRETTIKVVVMAKIESNERTLIIQGKAKIDQVVTVEMDLVARVNQPRE